MKLEEPTERPITGDKKYALGAFLSYTLFVGTRSFLFNINVLIFSFCFGLKCSFIVVLFKFLNQFGRKYFGFPSDCICQYPVLQVYILLLMR